MKEVQSILAQTAHKIVAEPRGILAADQSGQELDTMIEAAGGQSDLKTRLKFREASLRSPNLGCYLGGVILHYESIVSDINFSQTLRDQGIALGGTLDQGFTYLDATSEPVTKGFDGIEERLQLFRSKGCAFVKWRSVIRVSATLPSAEAVEKNMELSARYAAISQQYGLVPICEPDIAFAGDHEVERYHQIVEKVWTTLFQKLAQYDVYQPGIILKATWVVPGLSCSSRSASDGHCASLTVSSAAKIVPESVPGIAFLSGGLSLDRCLQLAGSISRENSRQGANHRFTFSYGRALLEEPIAEFVKSSGNTELVASSMEQQVRLASEASVAE